MDNALGHFCCVCGLHWRFSSDQKKLLSSLDGCYYPRYVIFEQLSRDLSSLKILYWRQFSEMSFDYEVLR
jgi:hypothetical protein